jgi:hypothetical protein
MKLNSAYAKLAIDRMLAPIVLIVGLFACCAGAAKAQLVNNRTYIITSVHSGLAITDPGASNTNSVVLEQQTVTNAPDQQWIVTNQGLNGDAPGSAGYFTLTNASSGQMVDVTGASHANSALVDQYPANGNPNQNWEAIHLSGNTYEVLSQNSGLALDVDGGGTANGEEIDQYTYGGHTWQQWIFTPVPVPANQINYGCIGACLTDGEAEGFDGPPPTQGAPGTTTFQLTAIASGNWNSAGVHTVGNYQIGHSNQLPDQQVSYFEFNLSSVQGRTVQASFVLIPGSTDYDIDIVYPTRCNPPTPSTGPCFKVGMRPLQGLGYSVADVVSGANNATEAAALIGNQNEDNGYEWVENGLHLGTEFGNWTYNFDLLQDEVSAGGDEVVLGADDDDTTDGANLASTCAACPGGYENYIWGSTGYNTGIIWLLTVQGGEASLPIVPNGTYEVKNLNNGGALEVAGKTAIEEHLDLAAYGGVGNQTWKVTRLADGNYSIRNAGTGSLLQATEEWAIIPYTDGNYTLKSVKTGKMLDVAGRGSLMGQSVVQMPAKPGYASQQWSFQPATGKLQASLDSSRGVAASK